MLGFDWEVGLEKWDEASCSWLQGRGQLRSPRAISALKRTVRDTRRVYANAKRGQVRQNLCDLHHEGVKDCRLMMVIGAREYEDWKLESAEDDLRLGRTA